MAVGGHGVGRFVDHVAGNERGPGHRPAPGPRRSEWRRRGSCPARRWSVRRIHRLRRRRWCGSGQIGTGPAAPPRQWPARLPRETARRCPRRGRWSLLRRRHAAAGSAGPRTTPGGLCRSRNLPCHPRPATTTRAGPILPMVCSRVNSPSFPVISPSSISPLMAPSRAWSTAPVAPPGFVTPLNRFTTSAGVSIVTMSVVSTFIFMSSVLPGEYVVSQRLTDAISPRQWEESSPNPMGEGQGEGAALCRCPIQYLP